MDSPWSLADLEIVGYANVLKDSMLPSVVPPVFRLMDDTQWILMPPYSFNAGFLCNATEVSQSELMELRDAGEITLFEEARPAIAGFELWVDQTFQEHYEPGEAAREKLHNIAKQAIHEAEEAWRKGAFEEAERLSGIAISADDRQLKALAIKAAIHRLRRNAAGERLMVELASTFLDDDGFALLVDHYHNSASKIAAKVADSSNRRPPMQGMALHHADRAA